MNTTKCRRIQENRDYWYGVAEELRQKLYDATIAAPAERVPEGCVVVRRSMLAETVRVLKNVDTQFRATGQPSGQVERLVNFLAPLTASPAPPSAMQG